MTKKTPQNPDGNRSNDGQNEPRLPVWDHGRKKIKDVSKHAYQPPVA